MGFFADSSLTHYIQGAIPFYFNRQPPSQFLKYIEIIKIDLNWIEQI